MLYNIQIQQHGPFAIILRTSHNFAPLRESVNFMLKMRRAKSPISEALGSFVTLTMLLELYII